MRKRRVCCACLARERAFHPGGSRGGWTPLSALEGPSWPTLILVSAIADARLARGERHPRLKGGRAGSARLLSST